MVPGSLCKVETLVGGIPPGTFSFQDPHRVIIEDAGMDFLNHPRFKCAQNVHGPTGRAWLEVGAKVSLFT